MWKLYQYCDVSIDNEDEFLVEVNTIEEAIKFVEDQCSFTCESELDHVSLEKYDRNIDYRKRNEYHNAFFKIEFIIDEDENTEFTFIAIADGNTTYFCERTLLREEIE